MPKNRHNSRDAKIQPSEVNECERPLISYSGHISQVKGSGDTSLHPTHNSHFVPIPDPQRIRPAALSLKSTTISQQPVQTLPIGSVTQPHGQKAPPPQRPRVQYCPKHAPSNSLAKQAKPKPPSSSKSMDHSFNPRTNAKDDSSTKDCSVDATRSQEPPVNSGATETHHEPHSPVQKNAKNSGKMKTKTFPAKSKPGKTNDVNGKAKKRHGPEVTSIPQTNMSIGLLVFCCFNPLLGALAIYLSLTAAKAYRDGNDRRGASRAHWSILMSLFGIMITMVVVSSLVVFFAVNKRSSNQGYRTSVSLPQGF